MNSTLKVGDRVRVNDRVGSHQVGFIGEKGEVISTDVESTTISVRLEEKKLLGGGSYVCNLYPYKYDKIAPKPKRNTL